MGKGAAPPAPTLLSQGNTPALPPSGGVNFGNPSNFNLGNFAQQFQQMAPQNQPLQNIPGMVQAPQAQMPKMPTPAPIAPAGLNQAAAQPKAPTPTPAPAVTPRPSPQPKANKFESFKKYLEGAASLATSAGNIRQSFKKPPKPSSGRILSRRGVGDLAPASGTSLRPLGNVALNPTDVQNVNLPDFLKSLR